MSNKRFVSASDPVETSQPIDVHIFFSANALAKVQEPFESEHVKH